ncbi:MAG TPA: hypothetical protein PKK48_01335 [Phycisphaerae bacterium]|nr:hypothetical protein [Phycisphaerae bacterium]
MLGWTIFCNPVALPTSSILWLLLPLTFAVSLVYRAIKTPDADRIWLRTLTTFVFLTAGMAALGVAIYLLQLFALRCL